MEHEQEDKRMDGAIDRVLQCFADSPPSEGMEARLLAALHARAAAQAEPRRRRLQWLGLAIATGLCVLAAGLFFARAHRPAQTAAHRALHARAVPRDEEPAVAELAPVHPPARVLPIRRVHHAARPMPATEAASFPAPPLPLSREEKLLLVIAQQRNPDVMALLNQRTQAKEMAWNRAEFAAYFDHPTEEEMEKHAQQSE